MFSLHLFALRGAWLFFLFISFWPWEKDHGQVKKTSLEIPKEENLLRTVRVALFYEKSKMSIATTGSYEIKGLPDNTQVAQGPVLASLPVRVEPSGIRLGTILYKVSGLRLTSHSKEVQIENRKYRDVIELLKNPKGSLTVVNEIDVEDYLKGVLPGEMDPKWPEEALKAQAVASRTYAIFKNIENKDFPFALSSEVGDQVYNGSTAEKSTSNRAVEKTRGEILTHRGKIFPAFFHSTCGGRTTRADYQWNVAPHPSLKGVECSFCRGSKFYSWKAELTPSEIQSLLMKKGFNVSQIKKISPEDLDISGRPQFFSVGHSKGSTKILANEFRQALGTEQVRSTLAKVERKGEIFAFTGRGWGHGVGMCQYGAKYLAQIGYRYTDILRYYYPESEVRNLDDLVEEARQRPLGEEEEERSGNVFSRIFHDVKNYFEEY